MEEAKNSEKVLAQTLKVLPEANLDKWLLLGIANN
jgi:hypothetical protein